MKKYLFSSLVILGMMLSACSSDEVADGEPLPDDMQEVTGRPIRIGTRAHDAGFHDGDRVGVYVVNSKDGERMPLTTSGNHANNQPFEFHEESLVWSSHSPIYWADSETPTDFYYYYPYNENVEDVNNHTVITPTDQTDESKQSSADFMWGRQEWVHPSADRVYLQFHRRMSRIVVYVRQGEGFENVGIYDGDLRVSISGVRIYSTIDLADGSVRTSGNTATIDAWRSNGYDEFKAIVPPQSMDKSAPLTVTVSYNGRKYRFSREFTFNAGKQYNFSLALNKTSSGMDADIDNWTEEDVDYGGVVE